MLTSNAATGYVAKISMLRLNIGSGKLNLFLLSIGRDQKPFKAGRRLPDVLFAFGFSATEHVCAELA